MVHHNVFKNFKGSTLIVVVCFRAAAVVEFAMNNILNIINKREKTWVVLINNNSHKDVSTYFHQLEHDQLIKFDLPFNFGKALAANFFLKEYINKDNLPQTIVSLDPDTIFSKESFELLVEASVQMPQAGMLGMRFEKNECNPERNLFFKPKKCIGSNGNAYWLKQPFMCTVAGPILAIQAEKIWKDCKNELFPKKHISVYGGDDSALYNALRWKYKNGYLEGTQATHLFSAGKIAEKYREKINQEFTKTLKLNDH